MSSLVYWIQRADLSAVDYDAVDGEDAVRTFATHDWAEELRFMAECEAMGGEYCPPGIGFVDPAGAILHVCPTADGRAMVHYHAEATRKLLGFIPIPWSRVHTKHGVQRSDVAELIHSFFEGRHDWVLRKLAAD